MKKIINTADISRTEWLEWRRKGIGGSDAAAIAGINPWKSPVAIYLDKTGQVPETDDNKEVMYWGNVLEDIVAREFVRRINEANGLKPIEWNRYGYRAQRNNFLLQHDEHEFMLANIDRELFHPERGRGILECKTTNAFNAKAWSSESVPDYYFLQVQHYLAVTGYEYAYIAVLIGGNKFKYFEILPDAELIANLIEIERDFWENNVKANCPPPLDGSASSSELLKYLYPEGRPETIILESEAEELIENYQYWDAQEKEAKKNKQEYENKLKGLLGEYERGQAGGAIVEWKTIKSNRLDSSRLKKEKPDLYAEYVKESSSRRFAIKAVKGGEKE